MHYDCCTSVLYVATGPARSSDVARGRGIAEGQRSSVCVSLVCLKLDNSIMCSMLGAQL